MEYHEAGHVLIALLMGYRESIEHVSMKFDKRNGTGAHVRFIERSHEAGPRDAQRDFKRVACNMGGIAAELVTGEENRSDLKLYNQLDMENGKDNACSLHLRSVESNKTEQRFEKATKYVQKYAPENWHFFKFAIEICCEAIIRSSKLQRLSDAFKYRQQAEQTIDAAINHDVRLINEHRDDLEKIALLLRNHDYVEYPQIRDTVPHLCL